jgi:conjugative relaxase-like TrwC/TraI family protein
VTVSVRPMSAGTGYRYLMGSVTVADGDRRMSTPMTRYYAEAGTPPGRWMGSGLAGLDSGRGLDPGSIVAEEQLFQLLGMSADPVTGDSLGRGPAKAPPSYRDRVHARLAALPAGLPTEERERWIEQIRTQEGDRTGHGNKAVAGFDLTFSVPKSVSAVWAIADAATQELIVQTHQGAVADALAWAERNVFATRLGHGGAVEVGVRGVIAAAFDHYDSRANDPHLHTHVVIANRVQAEADGKWRTLDSRAIFRATVALSELHQGLLMDRLTAVLGVGWDGRARRHSPVVQWEITGVSDQLRTEFSRRSSDIEAAKGRLVADYIAQHRRTPSAAVVLKLRQQATLQTRPDKHLHSLADLTEQWRERARPHIGSDTVDWVSQLPRASAQLVHSNELLADDIQHLAERTLAAVAAKRATFTRWNVYAETQRQLHPVRFATAADRELVGDRVTDTALGLAILLTPTPTPEASLHVSPGPPIATRRTGADRYTTGAILAAEDRLLAAGRITTAPGLDTPAPTEPRPAGRSGQPPRLTAEQVEVVTQIVTSGRALDVLVGAAGTGKTVALAGLAAAWQHRFGADSVIGLAPSAAAAEVLSEQLGLPTENTAKWITETALEPKCIARLEQLVAVLNQLPRGAPSQHRVAAAARDLQVQIQRWRIQPDQLVIIDEASLAGTLVLDRIVRQARQAGAKVLLAGDWAQLSAIDAGGAFGMLVRDRGTGAERAPELTDTHRFTHDWEKAASLDLRAGDPAVIDTYTAHGRIHDGGLASVLEHAYAAWRADQVAGLRTVLIAADAATVIELNTRAHADLVAAGRVASKGLALADGATIAVGDHIVTRRNDRTITTGHGWVKNGDQWTVLGGRRDGSLTARRVGGGSGNTVDLPADYVREHVELGYATTAHRAQGQTVDTAHALVTGPRMTRESLYVAMTRARHANHVYVATDYSPDADTDHVPGERRHPREILTAVLNNSGAELAASESIQSEQRAAVRAQQPPMLPRRITRIDGLDRYVRTFDGPERASESPLAIARGERPSM